MAVAAADGVPGIPSNIAETDPPVMPPIYVPSSMPIAGVGGIEKVIGRISARATVKVRPGIEPKTSPSKVPPITAIKASGLKARGNAARSDSMVRQPFRFAVWSINQTIVIQVPAGR